MMLNVGIFVVSLGNTLLAYAMFNPPAEPSKDQVEWVYDKWFQVIALYLYAIFTGKT